MKRFLKLGVFFLVFACIGGGIIASLDRNLQAEGDCLLSGRLTLENEDPTVDFSSATLHIKNAELAFMQTVNVNSDGTFVINFGPDITTPPSVDITMVFMNYEFASGLPVYPYESGTLEIPIRQSIFKISGHVVDADGNPLTGVQVDLNSDTPFITAADGAFEFDVSRGESVVITPSFDGMEFTPNTYSNTDVQADDNMIEFREVKQAEEPVVLSKPTITHKNSVGTSLASYQNDDQVEVTLTCSDTSLPIYYQIDGGSETLYDGTPFTVHSSVQTESSMTVSAYTKVGEDKSEIAQSHITFAALSTPPTEQTPLSRPTIAHQNATSQTLDTYKNDDVVTVTLSCTDASLQVFYKLDDDATYKEYEAPFILQANGTTAQDIQITSYSTNGIDGSDPTFEVISFAAKVNETPDPDPDPDPVVLAKPTIDHKNASNVAKDVYKYDEEVTITLSSTDDGVDLYYKVNDGSELKYTGPFKVKALREESHSQFVQAYAYDGDNYSEASRVILSFSAKESEIPTPTTPKKPTVKHANEADITKTTYPNEDKVKVTLSSTETGVSLYYRINDGIATLYSAPFTVQAKDTNADKKTIKVYAQKDGKQSEIVETIINFAEKGKVEEKDFVDKDGNQYDKSQVKLFMENMDETTIATVKSKVLAQKEFNEVDEIAYMEIHLKASNTIVQPNGLYSFVIPYPENTSASDTFYVLHIVSDNKTEFVDYEKQKDGIHVSVNSFSPFVIGVVKDKAPIQDNVDNTIKEGVKTGGPNTIALLTMVSIASASWIMIGYRRRRKN